MQNLLVEKYYECFPMKILKLSDDDKPWFSQELKKLGRMRKREYSRHNKSSLWEKLNSEFLQKCKIEKERYYKNIVEDLKESEPGKWHSKLKRMTGQDKLKSQNILIEELLGCSDQEQADIIAEHYSEISNQYDEINPDDFTEYLDSNCSPPVIEPLKVYQVIESMNKKAATVPGDIPMKIIAEFSVELANPLSHLFNVCLLEGVYPDIYKQEYITPAPKIQPPERFKDLRKISGFLNSAKIFDKLIAQYLISDMAPSRDPAQYGNERKLSIQHYLINMLHTILTAVDKNTKTEAYAVIVNMIDWSQAFDRQCHSLGIKSFIDNGVRPSLIPIVINYFQQRQMKVKWNGRLSSTKKMYGGGAQGGLPGIIEYLSQTNDCADFLRSDEKYRYIDDLSILEIINLISMGLSSYNCKAHVPNDVATEDRYLPPENTKSQEYLAKIEHWTKMKKMKLNCKKSKYMTINFTKNYQFSTRLQLENDLLEEVKEVRLLGVVLNNQLSWQSNTSFIVKKAYKRMPILHKLFEFEVPRNDLVEIYILYIRSVLESSATVWHSSITQGQENEIERVQKVALRTILKDGYIDYHSAMKKCSLTTLKDRRIQLCKVFAKKCTKSDKTSFMFPLKENKHNFGQPEKYVVFPSNTSSHEKSTIPYMQRLLNSDI